MSVLVDTSIWVEYFRSGNSSAKLDFLIDENLIATKKPTLKEFLLRCPKMDDGFEFERQKDHPRDIEF